MVHKQFSGITLVVLGSLTLLQVLGMYNFGLALWPVILLWLGLEIVWGSLFDHWSHPSVFGTALGLFIASIGLVKILANAGWAVAMTTGDLLRYGWPVLLVALGLGLLFRRGRCYNC
jgi:lia operon protein LiaF